MKLVCYGDSNTYGYDGDVVFGGRFAEDSRWPELLGRLLGAACANCGLNGRRVPRFARSVEADLALLRRQGDGALLLLMLGTNDLLSEAEPRDTAAHMRSFLERLSEELPESVPVLIAPPAVAGVEGFSELAAAYAELALTRGIPFVDASAWPIPVCGDGVHFTARGHRLFAMRMSQSLRALWS